MGTASDSGPLRLLDRVRMLLGHRGVSTTTLDSEEPWETSGFRVGGRRLRGRKSGRGNRG